jgi:hypothetical protein
MLRCMAWDLFFTLPNVDVPTPSPFVQDAVCLCAANDERMRDLVGTPANDTARLMLTKFTTYRGEAYQPACLLVHADAPASVRDTDALRAFRNVCAVATTTSGWATAINGGQSLACWSDHFLFGHFAADRSGWVQPLDGAWGGSDDELPYVQSSPAIGRPSDWSIRVDEPLCRRLLICWQRCFVRQRDRRAFRRLFRALEVAFHAGQYPGDGLTSINDIGTRIGLWVSAFEVLCHPHRGDVNKLSVIEVLNSAPLDANVAAARYAVNYRGQTYRVSLAADIYDDLYAARNSFMHGNPVTTRDLRYRRSGTRLQLAQLAPLVFNVALLSYLEGKVGGGPIVPQAFEADWQEYARERLRRREGVENIQEALLASRYPLNEYGRPVVPD